jgi:5-methylthioadenosine/S-adenosylhomocysteine deaminase
MDAERRIIEGGAVAVKGEKIIWVGKADSIPVDWQVKHKFIAAGKVLIPGIINTHGHWAMTLFRGYMDDDPLETWLQKAWQVEGAVVSPENVKAGSQLAMIEMIRGGTTCAADMYWQYRTTTEAAIQAGFRMVNGPSFTEIAGYQGKKSTEYPEALEYLDTYQTQPLIRRTIQMHSTYTTNMEMMENAKRILDDRGLLFITHASESRSELEMVNKAYGLTPIQVLDKVGLLGPRSLLAHCVHLSDDEIERLADTKTSVAHCPSSNLKLSSGIARVAELIKAGVTVSIGTDGPASNNDLDMFHEAQLAAMVQKGVTGDPTVLPARQVFELMTVNGARAIGMPDDLGAIEVDRLADLALINFNAPHLTPCYDYYSQLIYAVQPGDVTDVMIHGQMVMQNRDLLTLDEIDAKARVRKIADTVRKL